MPVNIGELNSEVVAEAEDVDEESPGEDERQWVELRRHRRMMKRGEEEESRTRARGFDD